MPLPTEIPIREMSIEEAISLFEPTPHPRMPPPNVCAWLACRWGRFSLPASILRGWPR